MQPFLLVSAALFALQAGSPAREAAPAERSQVAQPKSDGAPRLGRWKVVGRSGRDWEATLFLLRREDDAYSGHLLWRTTSGAEASGREAVTGTFDQGTRLLALSGREIVDAVGNITHAEYRARSEDDGRSLVEGTWGGGSVVPGTWSAVWERTSEAARTPSFSFHSHELYNLHHFLYQCAKTAARRDGERVAGRPVTVVELDAVDALEGDERYAWLAAVDYYRRELIALDLLFDRRMYALKQLLTGIEDADGEWPAGIEEEHVLALRAALPVYRARFWPAHDAANRGWIATAVDALERHEAELVERMTSAYGGSWPPPPVRVDLCAYANWAGAYTTGGPAHVTLSSTDADNGGHGALETLVHEASHTPEMIGALRDALAAAYAARGAEPPDDLWHLFLFVTAGESVRRTLAGAGVEGYVHYGERAGVYARGAWAGQFPLLLEPWTAFLDGEINRATALARIAEAID